MTTGHSGELGDDWQKLVSWVLEAQDGDLGSLATPETVLPPDSGAAETTDGLGETATAAGQEGDGGTDQAPTPSGGVTQTPSADAVKPSPSTESSDPDATSPERGDVAGGADTTSSTAGSVDHAPTGIVGDGIRFSIGKTIDGVSSQDVQFWPSNTALNQMNIGVVGDLGTGKTQFLKSVVYQLREGAATSQPTPISMLIFDYKRDYHDEAFLNSVGGRLLRPFHIPLNVLAISGQYTPQKAVQVGGAFVDVITKIYGGIGPIQRSKVLVIIKDLFAAKHGVAPTLGEVYDAYLAANSFDSVAGVLSGFVLNEVFSEEAEELVTMEQLLEDSVLVLAVSDLGADDNLKTALITLFLNKYYEYMLRLEKWPFEGAAPHQLRRLNSFVLVDEATNVMHHEFPVLNQLLLQGREFGVGVILASQYVSHFRVGQTNYGETLLTKVVHKVPTTSVAELKSFGIPSATTSMASRVPTLAVHQALCETLGVDARFMRGTPYFELVTDQGV